MMLPKLIKRLHACGMRWSLYEEFPLISPGVTSILACLKRIEVQDRMIATQKAVWDTARDKGADRGTQLHVIFADILQGVIKDVPSQFSRDVSAFKDYIDDLKIKPLYTEVNLFHPSYGYSGTVDFIGEVDGKVEIWDFKTGRNYDINAGWQMAAYRLMAEIHLGIKIEGLRGLHIRDGRVRPFIYTHIKEVGYSFLALFQAWKGMYYNDLMKRGIEDRKEGRKYLWSQAVMDTDGYLIEKTKEE